MLRRINGLRVGTRNDACGKEVTHPNVIPGLTRDPLIRDRLSDVLRGTHNDDAHGTRQFGQAPHIWVYDEFLGDEFGRWCRSVYRRALGL
ncbi:hypothetical protein ABFZ85_05845 [Hyphococcus formosus]|uniref:hypothetical protein n=1 Tax=Hyphococcus formosus TaxID=3143534 RepID=UPI00398ABF3A